MVAPVKKVSFDDEGGPSEVTSTEWILLERYRRGSRLDGWSQSDKVTLISAFRKAYEYSNIEIGLRGHGALRG